MDRLRLNSFRLGRMALALCTVTACSSLAAAFDKNVTLWNLLAYAHQLLLGCATYLQGVLSREALVAVGARERLDCQVNPLVSLQVVVAVEALRALVALEWSVGRGRLLMRVVPHEVRHLSCMSTVEAGHHARMHTNQSKPAIWVLNVREHWRRSRCICRGWWSLVVRR